MCKYIYTCTVYIYNLYMLHVHMYVYLCLCLHAFMSTETLSDNGNSHLPNTWVLHGAPNIGRIWSVKSIHSPDGYRSTWLSAILRWFNTKIVQFGGPLMPPFGAISICLSLFLSHRIWTSPLTVYLHRYWWYFLWPIPFHTGTQRTCLVRQLTCASA